MPCAFTDARRINNLNHGDPMDRPDIIVVIACILALAVASAFIWA